MADGLLKYWIAFAVEGEATAATLGLVALVRALLVEWLVGTLAERLV